MHWTLVTLLTLCVLCVATNAVQLYHARPLGVAGLLICVAWAIQQSYWWATGGSSYLLFVTCDLTIIGWLLFLWWKGRAFHISERLIAATIPLTTALVTFAELNGDHTKASWWTNIVLVAAQMALGLPPMEWVLQRLLDTPGPVHPQNKFDPLPRRSA